MFGKRPPQMSVIASGTVSDSSDASLVMASLGGDRDAFCEIVARYQNLLCSLAYSSVGDLKHSEDIAQETFVEAWKKLDTLSDPMKLKAWLCGILRFKTSHFHRKEAKQPIKNADELNEQVGGASEQSGVEDEAISNQQEALLWQTLEQMPENYREPLILFYREQRSVEHVAEELALSEDTVKQRLSRGRKLLQNAMVTFVEDTLEKSKPGAGFTLAVLASINLIPPPAKAAAFSAGALKTGSVFSLSTLVTLLAIFSGVISSFFSLRASLDLSRTQRERRTVIKYVSLFFIYIIIYIAGMYTLQYFALIPDANLVAYALASQLLVLALIASYLILVVRMFKGMRSVRAQERLFNPEAFKSEADQVDSKQREYKSKITIAGVPLYHLRLGMPEKDDKPVIAWVAGGDQAFGLLFAWGGIAIAPISVGIVSIGVVSIGAISFGILSLGTIALGLIGFGASAIAYKAYSSLSSVGLESAVSGGFSIAGDAALGSVAIAEHVNSDKAAEIADLAAFNDIYLWGLAMIAVFVIVPAVLHSNSVRKEMKQDR